MTSFRRAAGLLLAALVAAAQLGAAPKLDRAERRMTAAVAADQARSIELLERLVNVNSGTLNLAGVEQVIALEDELERTRARLDRMEREMREAIAAVHKSYRRDLVPISHTKDLIPRTDNRRTNSRWISTS